MTKKIVLHKEVVYLLATVLMALAVSLVSAANFGLSMIAAPAYIVAQALGITFGQGEYIVETLLLLVFCLVMKKFKVAYLSSFITGILYGAVLDLWRLIPALSQATIDAGTLPMGLRIFFFVVGELLTALAVALFFQTYLYPQIYDLFVKGIAGQYKRNRTKVKIAYDTTMLLLSVGLTLALFHRFVGVGIGTLIMCLVNGALIGFMDRTLNKWFEFTSFYPKYDAYFMKQIEFIPEEDKP